MSTKVAKPDLPSFFCLPVLRAPFLLRKKTSAQQRAQKTFWRKGLCARSMVTFNKKKEKVTQRL